MSKLAQGHIGTLVAFHVGVLDAEILEKEFYPTFTAADLVTPPNHAIYLKLMIDGVVSARFSGEICTHFVTRSHFSLQFLVHYFD